MRYSGVVGVKARVDACGTFIDTITVKIDGDVAGKCRTTPSTVPSQACDPARGGQSVSPEGQSTFAAVYQLATQFGGLSVMDTVDITESRMGAGVHRHNQSTINSVPVRR
jgi:hypothetical protein